MAAGDFLTWAVQSQDAPAHVARILQTILLNEGVVDKAGGSFETTEDTGSNMNITVGSGTLGDLAVVEGDDTAGQGVYVIEAQNATVTKTIAASDPSDDRIDLVVLQNYDDEADSSGNNDAEVEVIEGTPAGSPSAPALPDSAIPLAEVVVGAGVTAITDANITDTRAEATLQGPLLGGVAEIGFDTNSTAVTHSSNQSLTRWGGTVSFPNPGHPVSVTARVDGDVDRSTNEAALTVVRVRISFNGGSTWSEGLQIRHGLHRNASFSSATQYIGVHASHSAEGTPTGDIVVDVQHAVAAFTGTGSVRWQARHLSALVVPA